ncbi:hypothetical protein DH2020_038588 [Rehmannia glutinosa]|uniref:Uncharacterized protein n=1 Tax=Rehmannia glutinosa TaxID=99300 RepID=A0ABR0UZH4_REHGL
MGLRCKPTKREEDMVGTYPTGDGGESPRVTAWRRWRRGARHRVSILPIRCGGCGSASNDPPDIRKAAETFQPTAGRKLNCLS